MAAGNIKSQMLKGILEYCVLLSLSHGEAYPSEILEQLRNANLIVLEGTLYTLLSRLKREGKLDYRWEESPKGPPRKYFSVNDEGRKALEALEADWKDLAATVDYFHQLNKPQ